MDTVDGILEELGVTSSARAIYIALLQHGEATARMLAERTGITRTSVYDQVRILHDYNLVTEREVEGKTYFGIGDVRQVDRLLSDHIERLEIGKGLLEKNLSKLVKQTHTTQPKIRFFEGREGVQQMLRDMLWYESSTVSMCWSYAQMLEALSIDYLERFNERRVREHIALRTVWSHEDRAKKKHLFIENDQFVERRYTKKGQEFHMSYAIYGNSVAFVSSTKEAYGFVVQSNEFSELMLMQFELLWNNAKK